MSPIRRTSARSAGQFFAIVATICGVAYSLYGGFAGAVANLTVVAIATAVAAAASAVKVTAPSARAVVLRRGRLHALRGPGLFRINPLIDTVPYWIDARAPRIDARALPIAFQPQPVVTHHPVHINSAMFWKVFDPATVAFGQPARVTHYDARSAAPGLPRW